MICFGAEIGVFLGSSFAFRIGLLVTNAVQIFFQKNNKVFKNSCRNGFWCFKMGGNNIFSSYFLNFFSLICQKVTVGLWSSSLVCVLI